MPLVIAGWKCPHCQGFVGEEKETHSVCIYCDKPKHKIWEEWELKETDISERAHREATQCLVTALGKRGIGYGAEEVYAMAKTLECAFRNDTRVIESNPGIGETSTSPTVETSKECLCLFGVVVGYCPEHGYLVPDV